MHQPRGLLNYVSNSGEYTSNKLHPVRCQETTELEWMLGSHLVQPPTPGWVPSSYFILEEVHLSRSDANSTTLPGSLCWCSMILTVIKLLLDTA